MQASQAKNEVRLPRAVLARSAAIQATLDARQATRESELVPPVATPPAVEVPPAAPPEDPRKLDPKYWEQRFRVTEGLLATERTGRTSDAQATRQRIAEMQTQIDALQAGVPAAPTDLTRFFTAEQIEKFGEEQCRTMATAAEAAADAKIRTAIETQVKPLVDARKADQVSAAQAASDRFTDALTEAYPNWRAVDVDPGWLAWLAQPDEATGLHRQTILDNYGQRRDAARIAQMFRQYEGTTQPPVPPLAPHGNAANGNGAPPAPTPVATKGKPTKAEIQDFYKRKALGKVKEPEREEFEARLKQFYGA